MQFKDLIIFEVVILSLFPIAYCLAAPQIPELENIPIITTTVFTTITAAATQTPVPNPGTTIDTSQNNEFIRGVNIGGWLVLEEWMDKKPFEGTEALDEYTLTQKLGKTAARAKLETHWKTFFTEEDVIELKATGINALRIPVGYWAFEDFSEGTPYVDGSEAYLDLAIGWARTHKMKVWVDLHGAPGSQNGFDNSGQYGEARWQQGDNIKKTFEVLKVMARKYGDTKYADVVHAIQLINEPISWDGQKFETTYQFSVDAYWKVKELCTNKKLQIIMHDAFTPLKQWTALPGRTSSRNEDGSNKVGIDAHLYQIFLDEDKKLTQDEHAAKACKWAEMLRASNNIMPTYVGEWTAATDICAFPDGHTEPGTTCNVKGCQCQTNTKPENWSESMRDAVRKYVEAELDAFENSTSGFFFWTWKAPGAWNFMDGVRQGWIPQPLTARKFPDQCGYPSPKTEITVVWPAPKQVKRGILRFLR